MKNAKSHGQAPLLAPHIDRLRSVSYSALAERARRSDLEAFEAIDADGDVYQMEILYLWNGKREGDIGVMGFALVNACGASVSDDFILTPEGRFVGE